MPARNNRIAGIAGVAGVAILAAVTLAGCTMNLGTPNRYSDSGMMGDSGPRDGVMGGTNSSAYGNSDIMFALMMIPHHQQAIDMSDRAIATSANPGVLALAKRIREAQAPEIAQMTGWLDDAGASGGTGRMDDMGMGGMLSDEELAELEHASGVEFDRLYLEGMIRHHQGAIQMTHLILDSRNSEVRQLGESIVTSQTAEIAEMRRLLAELDN